MSECSKSTCGKAGPDGSGCASCVSALSAEAGLKRQDEAIAGSLGRIKRKLFVMSGKGGVGKSSVAVNIAAGLAQKGFKVGILDVDIHGPSVPNLLNLRGGIEASAGGDLLVPARYSDNLHVMSMDSLLRDKNTAVLWRGPRKTSAIRQFIADVDWGELDFLVIDSPPGTGDEHMTVLKTIPDVLSVVVTTPQEIALADVRKALNFLQHAGGKILGLVENMSGLRCPHCGKEIDLFRKGGGRELADKYGIPFLGAVPLDPFAVVAADRGQPVVLMPEDCPAKQGFFKLVEAIIKRCRDL